MRAGLVLVFCLAAAAPAAAVGSNGPIAYEVHGRTGAEGTCSDIATAPPGGRRRFVAETDDCEQGGRFSPSGRRIAWTAYGSGPRASTRLYVAGRRGRAPREVAERVFGWGWSNTGEELVYVTVPPPPLPAEPDLWVTDAFGNERKRLTDTPERPESHPSWSPDGSLIAFLANGDLYTMAPDGTDEVRLTEGAEITPIGWGGGDSYPVWSPDSSKIAVVSTRDDTSSDDGGLAWTAEIYVTSSTGGEMTNVSNLPETKDVQPQWLDDRRLVWVAGYEECEGDCDDDIYVARWDGNRRRILAGGPHTETAPTVSPNEKWIAFNWIERRERPRGPYNWAVYKIRSDGTRLTKLVGVRAASYRVTDWAPKDIR